MRGRKPLPTPIKVLRGNPGKRALNAREPKPKRVIPPCPAHLDAEAKREWRRITKQLHAMGLVAEVDRAAIALYCQAWSRWVDAQEKLAKFGAVVKAPSGYPVQSPYLAIATSAAKEMMKVLVEFGMTASSRSRLQATGEEPADDTAAFLFGGRRRA